ncbi:MAG: GMC family oxidoreductase [Leptolyngbya sp. DLM2.Bin15]|nr:MAG: GMC family oxidoreductase [Leptolyngbya sp. DLM2.Bin15]
MLVDARTLPQDTILNTDVCIVGAGPAGLAIARELIGQSMQVILLEGGGDHADSNSQSLCESKTVGQPCSISSDTRYRSFGGTSNYWCINTGEGQWGVRHTPLDAIDFQQRDWVPYSGWPFALSHLAPYYERAQQVCYAGPFAYHADPWESEQSQRLTLDPDLWQTSVYQFGLRDIFTKEYRQEIQEALNITTYLNANVTELETDGLGRYVSQVKVACLNGPHFWVQARMVILAAGGVETAQLLLLSKHGQKLGLGNENDLVGRFFMEHPRVRCGSWIPAKRSIIHQMALYDLHRVNTTAILGKLTPSEAAMHREHLLNVSAMLFPRPKPYQIEAFSTLKGLIYDFTRSSEGSPKFIDEGSALKTVLQALRDPRNLPEDFVNRLIKVLRGLDFIVPRAYRAIQHKLPVMTGLARGGWSKDSTAHQWFHSFDVLFVLEQEPDFSNRIILSSEHDQLGRLKAELHWQMSDRMLQSVVRSQDLLARAIAQVGLGTLHLLRDSDNLPVFESMGSHHHMGTTRMHPNPRQGVVDENCRVHGIDNLYIASSAVFPTGGYANPTLTIVALALRLADQIKVQYRKMAQFV